ncbi:MAG: capsule assembly Wzi family protein, partial [Nitrospirae bacterium]
MYTDSDIQALNYNNNGEVYKKGSNLRVGFSSRADFGWLSLSITPEVKYSGDGTSSILKYGYGTISILGLDLTVGKDSQWWGPGYHGAILLSNNSEPLTFLRLTNPEPVLLPWIFRNLGPFRFTFFVTKLEKDRAVPEPYLWGMRLDFKPIPYVEVGLQRTAILGGKDRPEGLNTWWDSFTGKGENDPGEPGDQKAGGDLKLILPFKFQPIEIYAEGAGEDEAKGWPSRWAYLVGIYLPRIYHLERIGFRAEYATTHVKEARNYWYRHHIYRSGYTYKGRIIGHHVGTDAKDIFLEVSWLIPEKDGKVSFSYDREEHNLSGTVRERKDEFIVNAGIELKKDIKIKVFYGYGKIKNMDNTLDN